MSRPSKLIASLDSAEEGLGGSGYTVLHQAAFHGAPAEWVQELVSLGAWRA